MANQPRRGGSGVELGGDARVALRALQTSDTEYSPSPGRPKGPHSSQPYSRPYAVDGRFWLSKFIKTSDIRR